ncbi:MAG: hypothetical protein VW907_04840 [Opitutae bacterium]
MNKTIHLVMDTPGANASQILQDATRGESPPPSFLFPENNTGDSGSWKLLDDNKILEFCTNQSENPVEIFLFLSNRICLATQIDAILQTLKKVDDLVMGRFILFLYSPILLNPPPLFQNWLDGVTHFTDVLLFVSRSNDTSALIKDIQERYQTMHYPMEKYILAQKNNSWSRILDPTPRRISHVFDDPELLDPEDLPENDRYLALLPSGERERTIPLAFESF